MILNLLAQTTPLADSIPKGSTFSEWLLATVVVAVLTALGYIVRNWLPSLLADFKTEMNASRELFSAQINAERSMWSLELDKAREQQNRVNAHQEKMMDRACEQFQQAVAKFTAVDEDHASKINELQRQLNERRNV